MAKFIKPKLEPCGLVCEEFNSGGQCPKCGWLKHLKGDFARGLREMPLGPPEQCSLGIFNKPYRLP